MIDPIPYPRNSKFWGARFVNKIFDRADSRNDHVSASVTSPFLSIVRGIAALVSGPISVAQNLLSWTAIKTSSAQILQYGTRAIALPSGESRARAANVLVCDDLLVPRSATFPVYASSSPVQDEAGDWWILLPDDIATDSPVATSCFVPASLSLVYLWEKAVVLPEHAAGDFIVASRPTRVVLEPRDTPISFSVAVPGVVLPDVAASEQTPLGGATSFGMLDGRLRVTVTPRPGEFIQLFFTPYNVLDQMAVMEISAV